MGARHITADLEAREAHVGGSDVTFKSHPNDRLLPPRHYLLNVPQPPKTARPAGEQCLKRERVGALQV